MARQLCKDFEETQTHLHSAYFDSVVICHPHPVVSQLLKGLLPVHLAELPITDLNDEIPNSIVSGFSLHIFQRSTDLLAVKSYLSSDVQTIDLRRGVGELRSRFLTLFGVRESISQLLEGLPQTSILKSVTPSQLVVILLYLDGLQLKQMAYALGVGEATIKAHMHDGRMRAGLRTRYELNGFVESRFSRWQAQELYAMAHEFARLRRAERCAVLRSRGIHLANEHSPTS